MISTKKRELLVLHLTGLMPSSIDSKLMDVEKMSITTLDQAYSILIVDRRVLTRLDD